MRGCSSNSRQRSRIRRGAIQGDQSTFSGLAQDMGKDPLSPKGARVGSSNPRLSPANWRRRKFELTPPSPLEGEEQGFQLYPFMRRRGAASSRPPRPCSRMSR